MRSPRTQHSTSTSGSNRRVPPPRGSSSPAHLGPPPSSCSSPFGLSLLRGVSSRRGAPPEDPRFPWIRSPFFWSYVFVTVLVYARDVRPGGRPDVFSRPRLRTTSSLLLHSSILLIPTRSSCASMVWTDTAFGASGCSRTGLCGLVATHFGCPHRVSVSWMIFQLTTRGGAGSDSSGIQTAEP